MRRIITVVAFLALATGCTSDTPESADPEIEVDSVTAFAERLYGSVWEVSHARPPTTNLIDPFRNWSGLGSISFYGTPAEPSVSVNHPCGSATTAARITDDRIHPEDFRIPALCEGLAVFMIFGEPEIEAAFRGPQLELTTDAASLSASHFVSVSDNGTAPLLVPTEDDLLEYAQWERIESDTPASSTFSLRIRKTGRSCGSRTTIEEPEIEYGPEQIRIAIPVRIEPFDIDAEIRRLEELAGADIDKQIALAETVNMLGDRCDGGTMQIQLDEPVAGRDVVQWIRPTTAAR